MSSAGEVPIDEVRAREMLERNRLEQFLDRAFMTDWGIKEVSVGETFPMVPCLPDDEYFMLSDGRARALWPEAPVVKSFLEAFPHWGVAARTLPAPGQEALDRWASENGARAGTLMMTGALSTINKDEALKRPLADIEASLDGAMNQLRASVHQ